MRSQQEQAIRHLLGVSMIGVMVDRSSTIYQILSPRNPKSESGPKFHPVSWIDFSFPTVQNSPHMSDWSLQDGVEKLSSRAFQIFIPIKGPTIGSLEIYKKVSPSSP